MVTPPCPGGARFSLCSELKVGASKPQRPVLALPGRPPEPPPPLRPVCCGVELALRIGALPGRGRLRLLICCGAVARCGVVRPAFTFPRVKSVRGVVRRSATSDGVQRVDVQYRTKATDDSVLLLRLLGLLERRGAAARQLGRRPAELLHPKIIAPANGSKSENSRNRLDLDLLRQNCADILRSETTLAAQQR